MKLDSRPSITIIKYEELKSQVELDLPVNLIIIAIKLI